MKGVWGRYRESYIKKKTKKLSSLLAGVFARDFKNAFRAECSPETFGRKERGKLICRRIPPTVTKIQAKRKPGGTRVGEERISEARRELRATLVQVRDIWKQRTIVELTIGRNGLQPLVT